MIQASAVTLHGAKEATVASRKQFIRQCLVPSPLLGESIDWMEPSQRFIAVPLLIVDPPTPLPSALPPHYLTVSGTTAATGSAVRRALPASAAPAGRRRTTSASTATDGRLTRPSPNAPSATTLRRNQVRVYGRREPGDCDNLVKV